MRRLGLILMLVKQRSGYFILLAGALFTNFIISFELKGVNLSSMIFDIVEILHGSMNANTFWRNLPHTVTTLAGIVSVVGIFSLIVCLIWTNSPSFKGGKVLSTPKAYSK